MSLLVSPVSTSLRCFDDVSGTYKYEAGGYGLFGYKIPTITAALPL